MLEPALAVSDFRWDPGLTCKSVKPSESRVERRV